MTTEEEFWLKKRGRLPMVTYHGSRMKAHVTIEIPLSEIAEHLKIDTLRIAGKVFIKEHTT